MKPAHGVHFDEFAGDKELPGQLEQVKPPVVSQVAAFAGDPVNVEYVFAAQATQAPLEL